MSDLTPHQREQLAIATSARVGILTGSAGTGKSFTAAAYLKSLKGGYLVAAPTGKAAARLRTEGIPATTIHTLLVPGRNGHDSGGWGFFYNQNNPLPCSQLLVDEAPMVGTDIMRDLLAAVRPGTRVLFLGDPNQLPPVGHGRPVYDMLNSHVVPHGHLSEVHRYAGRIARVANAIKDGKPWSPSDAIDLEIKPPENLRHVEAGNAPAILKALPELIERMRARGFDAIEDVQVICGVNDRGQLSRKLLNAGLQGILNPDGERDAAVPFRVGDKIICLRNHTRKIERNEDVARENRVYHNNDYDPDEEKHIYIANGELGRITGLVKSKDGKKATGVTARFLGRTVKIGKDSFGDFDLAYAVTCHKFQGAQSPVVIVIADEGASQVASRAWWYTAITRAGQLCLTIGRRTTINQQCLRVDLQDRKTFLKERLMEWGSRRGSGVEDLIEDDFLASI